MSEELIFIITEGMVCKSKLLKTGFWQYTLKCLGWVFQISRALYLVWNLYIRMQENEAQIIRQNNLSGGIPS